MAEMTLPISKAVLQKETQLPPLSSSSLPLDACGGWNTITMFSGSLGHIQWPRVGTWANNLI